MPYDPKWPFQFERIRDRLGPILLAARIEHVGSTAVPGCEAKPIIDVSVGLVPGTTLRVDDARSVGLVFRSIEPQSVVFGVYGKGRVRLANVHVRYLDSEAELQDLRFRDFLRTHTDVARDYVRVKRRAIAAGKTGRDYTRAKAPFIVGLELRSRRWARRTHWAA